MHFARHWECAPTPKPPDPLPQALCIQRPAPCPLPSRLSAPGSWRGLASVLCWTCGSRRWAARRSGATCGRPSGGHGQGGGAAMKLNVTTQLPASGCRCKLHPASPQAGLLAVRGPAGRAAGRQALRARRAQQRRQQQRRRGGDAAGALLPLHPGHMRALRGEGSSVPWWVCMYGEWARQACVCWMGPSGDLCSEGDGGQLARYRLLPCQPRH